MYFLSYQPPSQGRTGFASGLTRVVIAVLVLGACSSMELAGHIAAVSRPQGEGVYKVGSPYQINGTWYHPEESFTYDAVGEASWYGPGFDGKLTANGEIYDQNALTAAHPTLQMPSLVRVLNLDNGRSVVVRVNDRGPFAHGRIIDVSRRAADLLGFLDQGTARVRVQVLTEESYAIAVAARGGDDGPVVAARPREVVQVASLAAPTPLLPPETPVRAAAPAQTMAPAPAAPTATPLPEQGGFFVQAGAFSVYDNASRLRDRLAPLATTTIAPLTRGDGSTLYLVQLGPIDSAVRADEVLAGVIDHGQSDARIVSR